MLYAKKVGFEPEYVSLLRNVMRVNPDAGTQFASMLIQDDEPLADLSQVCILFLVPVLIFLCMRGMKQAQFWGKYFRSGSTASQHSLLSLCPWSSLIFILAKFTYQTVTGLLGNKEEIKYSDWYNSQQIKD